MGRSFLLCKELKKRKANKVENVTVPVNKSPSKKEGNSSFKLNTSRGSFKVNLQQRGSKRKSLDGSFSNENVGKRSSLNVLTPRGKKQRTQTIRNSMETDSDEMESESSDDESPDDSDGSEENGDAEGSDDVDESVVCDDDEGSDGEYQSDAEQMEESSADKASSNDASRTTSVPRTEGDESLVENNRKLMNEEDAKKTVFVGNVPLRIKRMRIEKHFSKCGPIKSVRIRCVPVAVPGMSKTVAAKTQQFHENRNSAVAYVVFHDASSVRNALNLNGSLLRGHHLRVDSVDHKESYEKRKAVFIGNLPFDAEDDDLWKIFRECGEIESVRVVHDSATGVGKGYGYVNFVNAESVELALKMNNQLLKKRPIRVQRYGKSKRKSQQREGSSKGKEWNRTEPKPRHKPKSGLKGSAKKNTNDWKDSSKSFQGQKVADQQKMKKKVPKKKSSKMLLKKKSVAQQLMKKYA